ncbi:MAG TPA: hypothetical protein VGI48_09710 [Caldimonas sp.]
MNRARFAAVLVALLLAACGGSRSPTGVDVPPNDVSVSQVGPTTVAAGSNANFTVVVANGGRSSAMAVTIMQTVSPVFTTSVTCVPSFGATCPATLGSTMSVPSLDPGRWLTLTYAVAVPLGTRGEVINTVQVAATGETDLTNDSVATTTLAVDERNGDYQAYAADGRLYDLTIDFDAQQYTMTGNGLSMQQSFVAGNGEYIVGGTSRLRVADDLVVGSHDFGSGPTPYVAARRFATTLVDSAFNLATRNVAADGTATTHPGTARISGNVLSVCQIDTEVDAPQNCPVVLASYLLSINGNVFTGVDPSNNIFTFQIARSGGSLILLSAAPAPDGTQQLRIGLQESAGFSWGTLFGPTSTGDWVTMVLDSTNISYAVLGAFTNDQAGLQKISNAGPFAMMSGKRLSDTADIFVMQATPLAVMVGAFYDTANGTLQVAVP